MCDTSNYAIGAVLGQRFEKQLHVIYYASRTLHDIKLNYTTEKEFLAVIFALEKFWSYLIGSHILVYTDHAALRHLWPRRMQKQDWFDGYSYSKSSICKLETRRELAIWWLTTGRLPNALSSNLLINEYFPDEQLFPILREPWFDDIVNFLVTRKTPVDWSRQYKYNLHSQLKYFYWDNLYHWKYYPDQIFRRCVPDEEQKSIVILPWSSLWGTLWWQEDSKKDSAMWILLANSLQRCVRVLQMLRSLSAFRLSH